MLKIRNSEWKVLFRQLVNGGKSNWTASEIIDKHRKIMEDYLEKLELKKNLSEEDMEEKFKRKFWELVQKSEV